MALDLRRAGNDLRRSIRPELRKRLATWLVRTAVQLRFFQYASQTPWGAIPDNTPLTKKVKAKKGFDLRPTMRRLRLFRSVKFRKKLIPITETHAQYNLLAGESADTISNKIAPLIVGRRPRVVEKKYKTKKGIKVYKRNVPAQVARDFVTHSPEEVQRQVNALACDIWAKWGFR